MPAPKKTLPLTRGAPAQNDKLALDKTGVALGKTLAPSAPLDPKTTMPQAPQRPGLPTKTMPQGSPGGRAAPGGLLDAVRQNNPQLQRTQVQVSPPSNTTSPGNPPMKTMVSPVAVPHAHEVSHQQVELAKTMAGTGDTTVPTGPNPSVTAGDRLDARLLGGPDPQKIERFVILRKLGEGGMGKVYSAFDEDLDRRVAIKLLIDEGMMGTQGRARIRREAQAMAKLNSPNVVQVYEVGEWERQVFVVMEYVKGQTLDEWSEDGEHAWRDVLEMHIQAGKGIAAAHAVGIIHRDYKPENVLVGNDGRARVLDFGLARADRPGAVDPGSSVVGRIPVDLQAEINTKLTIAGTIMGTPAYMSPEQHEGSPTDARSDQFSFCVALYEGIYRQRPYDGDTLAALSMAVGNGDFKPPPKGINVPPELFEIIKRGLSPNPAARYESMDTLLAELGHVLEPDQVQGFFASWRWPVLTAALVLAAIIVTAALTWGGTPTPEEEKLVNRLATEAVEAGSRTHWVYPAVGGDAALTSIRKIKELEDLEGSADELGEEKADELRDTFFETLKALGDRYWQHKVSRAYAAEYYMQALLFKDDATLMEEKGIRTRELIAMRDKALRSGFTDDEIQEAQLFDALAEDNPEERDRKLLAFAEAAGEGFGRLTLAADEMIEATAEEETKKKHRKRRAKRTAGLLGVDENPIPKEPVVPDPLPEAGTTTGGDTSGEAGDTVGDSGEETGEEAPPDTKSGKKPRRGDRRGKNPKNQAGTTGGGGGDEKDPEQVVDVELSNQLAKEGQAALAAGQLKKAEGLFNQALSAHNRNAVALIGLSDVFFERSDHRRAVKYAEKAVRIAKSNANYRIKLGDAYFKVLRYADARKAYEKAKSLGSSKAAGRLAKVKQQLGG